MKGYNVVVNTTKVRFFKQITTLSVLLLLDWLLLLIPQRYDFSSKSQLVATLSIALTVVVNTTKVRFFKQITTRFCQQRYILMVVVNTTKVRFFKQITTHIKKTYENNVLLLIPQRYDFSSKSQPYRECS